MSDEVSEVSEVSDQSSYGLKPEFAKTLALGTPIPPMPTQEWEKLCIDAEIAAAGMIDPNFPAEHVIGTLAAYVIKMSDEIRRLRLTYGEEVWWTKNITKEEIEKLRKAHEGQKEK